MWTNRTGPIRRRPMKDPVDCLTPLGLMVLALLEEGDMHPYEMIRLLRQRHNDRLVPITNGTMYHTVARLVRAGLLEEVGVDREGNRPERTTYTRTLAGRSAALEWVRRELVRTDRLVEFRVALAEAHNLPREEVVDLLQTRRAAVTGEHIIYRDALSKARSNRVPEQFLLEVDREQRHVETELAWLDDIIGQLEQKSYPWDLREHARSDRYLEQRKAARL